MLGIVLGGLHGSVSNESYYLSWAEQKCMMQVEIMLFVVLSLKLDKSVINAIATNDESAKNKSLVKIWCVTETNVVSIMLN